MIVTPLYFPPVSWFAEVYHHADSDITLNLHERYVKQTLRNRCYIDSPNGAVALTVPIDKSTFDSAGRCLMKDVKVSHQYDWQHQHYAALLTSYAKSPYYDYLIDDFQHIFTHPWTYLADLNEAILRQCVELLGLPVTVTTTSQETHIYNNVSSAMDYQPRPYYQVFAMKHGFLPNLSVLDLLFNTGNEALLYL